MYLAIISHGSSLSYQIRQSYRDADTGLYHYRLIFDLGNSPADHFRILAEGIPIFDDDLDRAVRAHAGKHSQMLLEKLLWRFLPRETRQHLSRFTREDRIVPGPLTAEDRRQIERQIHMFDRRRLHFLYYRAIDQSRLYTLREKALRPFLGQSRDEREYRFRTMEVDLDSGEFRNYIYATFNLQRHFSASFAPFLPEGLPPEEIADAFLEEICRLNADSRFWQGEGLPDALHPHLVRYPVMLFDFTPRNRTYSEDAIRQFISSHRRFRWPKRTPPVSEEKMSTIFSTPSAELRKMGRRQLTRLFRRLALQLHPDQGGDHDRFVELSEAYHFLLNSRKQRRK